MNLEKYKYNGFKLYERIVELPTTYDGTREYKQYSILVQYKNGTPFKTWREESEDSWVEEPYTYIHGMQEPNDKFIKNLTEEEVFGILL